MSDTIARLAALKAMHPGASTGRESSPGRLALLSDFGHNPGALTARYYLPETASDGCPLVVVLHGCTQNAAAYDRSSGWSQLADEAGFALLYPEQQRGNNPNLCFNWFQPGDTRREAGEVLSIRQMIEAMAVAHGIDRERIFITGLSAGGAMTATALATYPEVFAGGAIIAGLAHGMAKTVPEAFDRMRGHGLPSQLGLQRALGAASDHRGPWPRISIWQGSADQTVAPSNAEAIAAQWRGVHDLADVPTYSKASGALAKQVWCDASGDAVIEINTIAGMGHGTPLAPGLGSPGSYMLDVGISSTRHIAGFWGIADADVKASLRPTFASPLSPSINLAGREETPEPEPRAGAWPRGSRPDASGIQKILEDAFKAAGLMR